MKSWKWLGLLAALQAAPSWAQESAHSPHQGSKSAADKSRQAAASLSAPAGSGYGSAFSDYRPFVLDEPMKDWRAANDEVRDASGPMGVMKTDKPAQPAPGAHSGHLQEGGKP